MPKTCKSWLCPDCNVWLREGARKLIAVGAARAPEGWCPAMLTFTEPAAATLDLEGFYRRHQRTVQRLRSRGWLGEYATAVELQRRGALHPHVIGHVPVELVGKLRRSGQVKRDREQYRWWWNELRPLALELGWGPVVDAVVVEDLTGAAGYATKSLARYATKGAHRRLKEAGARRVRPIRASTGWAGGRLRSFQRGALADEGPWQDISVNGPCGASCAS